MIWQNVSVIRIGLRTAINRQYVQGGVRDAKGKQRGLFSNGNDYYHWNYRYSCGAIGLSIGLLKSTDTKSTAYDINSSLTDVKSKTMGGKGQPYMYLYRLNSSYYLDVTDQKRQIIHRRRMRKKLEIRMYPFLSALQSNH